MGFDGWCDLSAECDHERPLVVMWCLHRLESSMNDMKIDRRSSLAILF